ncbi:MAG: hypothetical protein KAH38_04860 [Candidatus Hydrogenedentes bacterium]|nr:hypothetical protein [Candidatus Hydrogenedentota bacterium]
MLRIKNLNLPIDHEADELICAAAKVLALSASDILQVERVRRSVDARLRNAIVFTYTVDVSVAEGVLVSPEILENPDVNPTPDTTYRFSVAVPPPHIPMPLIIGAGPCGLFGALLLARLGYRPLLLERGRPVRERMRNVHAFWRDGVLHPESNVLFGEGGAGTFSDGKLNTQIRDKGNRRSWIIRELLEAGAPKEIQYSSKPHIGTNNLIKVIEKIRETILDLGGSIRYESQVTGLIQDKEKLRGVVVNGSEEILAEHVLFAIGHSARDTFFMLHDAGVTMSQKPFSIGARIEHPQKQIDAGRYGSNAGNPLLGAAEYKAVWHCRNGRSVYTFCMCPGGHVIAACSEPEMIATNGMSHFARKGANANSGLLVGVGPEDYGDTHPLAGIEFQRRWEKAAYLLGGGGYNAPVQLLRDVLAGRASNSLGAVEPSYHPGVTSSDLRECLPDYVIEAWREAIPAIAGKIPDFDFPEAVLTGVETRSSSPVRITRNEKYQSVSLGGLFPAGEGAGYAGGIMSAAMDGMQAAEQIAISTTM